MTSLLSTDTGVLGKVVQHPIDTLDYFSALPSLTAVRATCSEVSALCPVTGQPDLYTLVVEYTPNGHVIETKSLKLFLWRYRDRGISCEDLAAEIANELSSQHPATSSFTVTATQQSRGGIVLTATAHA